MTFPRSWKVHLFLPPNRLPVPAFTSCPHSSTSSGLGTTASLPPEPCLEAQLRPSYSSSKTTVSLFPSPTEAGPKFITKYSRPSGLDCPGPSLPLTTLAPGSWPQPYHTACCSVQVPPRFLTSPASFKSPWSQNFICFFKTLFKWFPPFSNKILKET